MKWLELIGGLGVIALIAAGVYFLVTRLKWTGDEEITKDTTERETKE